MPIVIGYGNDTIDGLARAAEAAVPPIISLAQRREQMDFQRSEAERSQQNTDRAFQMQEQDRAMDTQRDEDLRRWRDEDRSWMLEDRARSRLRDREDEDERAAAKRWQGRVTGLLFDGEPGEGEAVQTDGLISALRAEAGKMDPRDFREAMGMLAERRELELANQDAELFRTMLQQSIQPQAGADGQAGAPMVDPAIAQQAAALAATGPAGLRQAIGVLGGAIRDGAKQRAQAQAVSLADQRMQAKLTQMQEQLGLLQQGGASDEEMDAAAERLESALTEYEIFRSGASFLQGPGIMDAERRFMNTAQGGPRARSSRSSSGVKPRERWDPYDWEDRAHQIAAKSGIKFETPEDYAAFVQAQIPEWVRAGLSRDPRMGGGGGGASALPFAMDTGAQAASPDPAAPTLEGFFSAGSLDALRSAKNPVEARSALNAEYDRMTGADTGQRIDTEIGKLREGYVSKREKAKIDTLREDKRKAQEIPPERATDDDFLRSAIGKMPSTERDWRDALGRLDDMTDDASAGYREKLARARAALLRRGQEKGWKE